MIPFLRNLFGMTESGGDAASAAGETDTVRRITDALNRLPPERARFLACYAYLLSRVAHANLEISTEETRAMEAILVEKGHLPEEQAIIVVQIARTQATLFGGTENYLVTREFNELATREEKGELLDCLFAVSAADESISVAEDNEVRCIAEELKLDHSDFIQARLRWRDALSVFRPPAPDEPAGD